MPKLSPEVEKLMLAARGLYDAMKRAKPTAGLAYALRDGVEFDRLNDEEILCLCRFVRELEKVSKAEPAAAAAAETVTPDAIVAPPKREPDDKKQSGNKGQKATPAAT